MKVAAASCKHPLTLGPVPVVCCNGLQGCTWIKTWKSWARFFKFQCNACKTHQKLLYSVLLCKFVWYILHNSTGACVLCMGKGTKKFKPQYQHTNSPNWSLYISLKNELREFDSRSKNFLLGDHFINSHNLSFDNVWILSGENWCWSLLGLKGLKGLHSVWGYLKLLRSVPWSAVVRRWWLCCWVVRCTHQGLSLRNLLQLWVTG